MFTRHEPRFQFQRTARKPAVSGGARPEIPSDGPEGRRGKRDRTHLRHEQRRGTLYDRQAAAAGTPPGTVDQLAGPVEPAMRAAAVRPGTGSAIRRRESSGGDRSSRVSYRAGAVAGPADTG